MQKNKNTAQMQTGKTTQNGLIKRKNYQEKKVGKDENLAKKLEQETPRRQDHRRDGAALLVRGRDEGEEPAGLVAPRRERDALRNRRRPPAARGRLASGLLLRFPSGHDPIENRVLPMTGSRGAGNVAPRAMACYSPCI